jgi:hypothetical protein
MPLPLHLFKPAITPIIEGLTEIVLSEALGDPNEIDSASHNQTVEILFDKILLMPQFLGFPMLVLILLFDWYGILSGGKRFHSQSDSKRSNQYHQWKNSTLGTCRDFILFFDRLSLFVYFSLSKPQQALNHIQRSKPPFGL